MSSRLESHADEVVSKLEDAVYLALDAIGAQAAGYVFGLAPADTGRLRNSIAWATKKTEGKSYNYRDDKGGSYTDQIGSGCPDYTVVIGTNVEYAVYQEFGTSLVDAQPYLRPGVSDHLEEYKKIATQILKDAF